MKNELGSENEADKKKRQGDLISFRTYANRERRTDREAGWMH